MNKYQILDERDQVGKIAADGGEIFNDYENNKAFGEYSTATGTQNIAGSMAFKITSFYFTEYTGGSYFILNDITGLAVDQVYSCDIDKSYNNVGKIVNINGHTVFVDTMPSTLEDKSIEDYPDAIFRIPADPTLGNISSGKGAFVAGRQNKATGYCSTSFGRFNEAIGDYSFTAGSSNVASGTVSFAEGNLNKAKGNYSHTEGYNNTTEKNYSHAEGQSTVSSGQASHTEGISTEATAEGAHAEGNTTHAIEVYTHSEGQNTTANGTAAHAEGSGTTASGEGSHSEGISTTASRRASHAEGLDSIANGDAGSHAEGNLTKSNGYASHAEGEQATADGQATHAEGFNTYAKQGAAHAEGWATQANGMYSHSEGNTTVANNTGSHAEGIETQANGTYSHTEGIRTETKEDAAGAHAEGDAAKAYARASHAEGTSTKAKGLSSHAEGYYTVANNDYSHSAGYHTKTGRNAQTVNGKWNIGKGNTLYEVGNGIGEDNRSNAFEVYEDGHAEIQTVGNNGLSVVNKDYVDQKSSYIGSFEGAPLLPSNATPGAMACVDNWVTSYNGRLDEGQGKMIPITGVKNLHISATTNNQGSTFSTLVFINNGDPNTLFQFNSGNAGTTTIELDCEIYNTEIKISAIRKQNMTGGTDNFNYTFNRTNFGDLSEFIMFDIIRQKDNEDNYISPYFETFEITTNNPVFYIYTDRWLPLNVTNYFAK